MTARAKSLVAIAPLLAALAGCTEEPITALEPDVPGVTSPTVEIRLRASELPVWRDTTFLGYGLPATTGNKLLAERSDLVSRVLARLNVPDSVFVGTTLEEVESFESASFRLLIDTLSSVIPGGYSVEFFALERSFDVDFATWTDARQGEPWTTPGGDLGALLAAGEVAGVIDTVVVPFGVPADSLLMAWRAADGEPGFAVVLSGTDTEVIGLVDVRAEVVTVSGDTVTAILPPNAQTFIYDPPQPPVGVSLRIGGLPSARFYLEFTTPDSLEGVPIVGSTINLAELVFHPFPPPAPPFDLTVDLLRGAVTVLADPFELGPKVPIGGSLCAIPVTGGCPFFSVLTSPDSLAAGVPLRVDITNLFRASFADSASLVRVAVRPVPDGQSFGLWDFGSVEDALALRPELLLLVTPPPDFTVP